MNLTGVGRTKIVDVGEPGQIPVGTFDVGDGYYDAKTGFVYSYDGEKLREPGKHVCRFGTWIEPLQMKSDRSGSSLTVELAELADALRLIQYPCLQDVIFETRQDRHHLPTKLYGSH